MITYASNVNLMLQELCWEIELSGVKQESRNGPVKCLPYPKTVCYLKPTQRVLIWPERDANPYFHLMESIWMLAGRRDVAWVSQFNSKISQYSDDGYVFHGAYGYRWRSHWQDQLFSVIKLLKEEPDTRRAVISMWDPYSDLNQPFKDIPCNTHIYFRPINGSLDMTVMNRSNDLIWGMCGANVVHFSVLHEFIAHAIGCVTGRYFHFTNNLHIYDNVPNHDLYSKPHLDDPYTKKGGVSARPMFTLYWRQWLEDAGNFCEGLFDQIEDPFFETVAIPMYKSWFNRKEGISDGLPELEYCLAEDWKRACEIWIGSRANTVVA